MAAQIDPARWSKGQVLGLRQWTEKLYSLQVEAEVQPFVAGQFTKVALEIGDELVGRPYSYVNAPHEAPLEFYFVTVPNGPLTSELVKLEAGNTIHVMRRPSGFLTLNEVPDARHLWLMSTGTAVGPFLSMLKTQEPWQRFERVLLIHAVRYEKELSYHDLIASIQERHPEQFQYIPFVSREETDYAIRGRVPGALEDGRIETTAGLQIDPDQSQVMICGNPGMVRDTCTALQARGLNRNRRRSPGHISMENYW
jgi:ferredoxin--NADP+ reductase